MTKKTKGAELFTLEECRGKTRLTPPRLSDLGTVETASDRQDDHDAKGRFTARNRASADRSAKRSLTAALRAARKRLREALEGVEPTAADALLGAAMSIYSSASRELGSRSILVASPLVSFSVGSVLESHYIGRAAEVGLESPAGIALVELAHRCSQQSNRAMVAALAVLKALGGKAGKPKPNAAMARVMAAAKAKP
jgi:hypothetical protein